MWAVLALTGPPALLKKIARTLNRTRVAGAAFLAYLRALGRFSAGLLVVALSMGGPSSAQAQTTAAPKPQRAQLLKILSECVSADEGVRAAAATAAGRTQHPLFLGPLRRLLEDPYPKVRVQAALALGALGVPNTSADLLVLTSALAQAARDRELEVATAAIGSLSRYPFPAVREKLQGLLRNRQVEAERKKAVLAALAANHGQEELRRLKAYLSVTRAEGAAGAASAGLGPVQLSPKQRWQVEPEGLLARARALLDPSTARREQVCGALGEWPERTEREPFLQYALSMPAPKVRRAAVEGLQEHETKSAQSALLKALFDKDLEVRKRVVHALSTRSDPKIARALVERLAKEENRALRGALAKAIRTQPEAEVLRSMEAWPRTIDASVRGRGIDIAASKTSTQSTELLVRFMMEAKRPRTHRKIRRLLRDRPSEQVIPPLLSALQGASNQARQRVLDALSKREDPRIADALIELMERGESDKRMKNMLSKYPEALVRPRVLALFKSDRERVRELALSASQSYQGEDVVRAAVGLLKERPDERRALSLLLRQERALSLEPLLSMLVRPEYSEHHRRILEGVVGNTAPAVAEPATEAALAKPSLAPMALSNLEVQSATVSAPLLARLAQAPGLAEKDRIRAIRKLSKLKGVDVVPPLKLLAEAEDVDIRIAARSGLHELDPTVYPSWDPYGRWPLVIGSAGAGAALLLALDSIADTDLSPWFVGGAGVVLGGVPTFLLTLGEDITLGDAGYFGTLTLWGTLGGWGVGAIAGLDSSQVGWGVVAGEVLGATMGALTMKTVEWGLDDAALANFAAIEAGLLAGGLRSVFFDSGEPDKLQKMGFAAMAGGAAATIPMAFLARRLKVSQDIGLLATTMAHGAFLGLWTPGIFKARLSGQDAAAGAIVGQGLGFFAGLVWAQYGDLSLRSSAFSGMGALAGASMLGGLGLMFDDLSGRGRYSLVSAGAAAGALGLGIAAPFLEFRENDAWIVALATAGGALSGGQFSVRLEEGTFNEASFPGGILLGAGAGLFGGVLVSQLVDLSDRQLYLSLIGAGVLGAGGVGYGLMRPEQSVQHRSTATSIGLLAGLGLTLPFAEQLDFSGPNSGMMTLGLATGALFGGFLPMYWHDENQSIDAGKFGGGALMGASIGTVAGIAVAQALELEASDVWLGSLGTLAGSAIGAGLGLLVPQLDRSATVGLMQGVGAAGLVGMTALSVSGLIKVGGAKPGKKAKAVPSYLSLFTGHGLLQGALIPYVWRADSPPGSEVAGGAMLGAGLGAMAGLTALYFVDTPLDGGDLAEASMFSVAAHGLGAGAGLMVEDRRWGAALMEGLGLASYAAAHFIAPRTTYDDQAAWTFLSNMSAIGLLGAGLPLVWDRNVQAGQVAGGAMAGFSLGALSAATLIQLRTERDDLEHLISAAVGSGMGAGLGLLFSAPDQRRTAGLLEGVGLASWVTSMAVSPHTSYGDGDLAAVALGTAAGAYTGLFLQGLLRDEALTARGAGGGLLLGAGAGTALAMGAVQWLEPEPEAAFETAALMVAAGAIGGGLQLSLGDNERPRRDALILQAGALGGLALGAAISPYTRYEGKDAGLIALMTGALAWHGAWVPSFATEASSRQFGGGALAGAGVGALGGVMLAQLRPLELADQVESGLIWLAGNAIGGGLAWMVNDPSPAARGAMIDVAGLSALTVGLALSPYAEFTGADHGLIGMSAALGAWHGLWLEGLIRPNGQGMRGDAMGGGALLGLGAGAVLSGIASQFVEVEGHAQVEAGLSWAAGSAIGAGLGLLAPGLDRRETIGLMEGVGAAGFLGGLLLADTLNYQDGDLVLIPLGALFGGALGLTLPTLVEGDEGGSAQSLAGGALLGAGSGALATAVASQFLDLKLGSVIESGVSALVGQSIGLGLGLMIPGSDRRARFALMDGVGIAGLTAGLLFSPYTEYRGTSMLDLGLGASMGALIGGLTPAFWNGARISDAPGEQIGGGVLLGTGVGLGAGLLLNQALEVDGDTREDIALGASMGALAGAGVGLLASTDDRVWAGLTQGLTLAGAVTVGLTGRDVDYGWGDLGVGSAYVSYLTWHAMGLTLLLDGTDRQAAGTAVSTVGLGVLTGMYLTPYIHLNLADVLMLLAGNVWGTWIGGWGGQVIADLINENLDGRRQAGLTLLSSVLGSDIGMAITGMMVSEILDVPPTQFAVINLAGLGGMVAGMLTAGFTKNEPLKAGNVIGSFSGLLLGAIITSFFDWSTSKTWDQLLARKTEEPGRAIRLADESLPVPKPSGSGFGLEAWFPSAQVQQGAGGEEQYLFTVMGVFK